MLLRRENDWLAVGILRAGKKYVACAREFKALSEALPATKTLSAHMTKVEAVAVAIDWIAAQRGLDWRPEEGGLWKEAFSFDPFAGIEPLPDTATAAMIRAERIRRSVFAASEAEAKRAKAEADKAKAEADKAEALAVAEFQARRYQKIQAERDQERRRVTPQFPVRETAAVPQTRPVVGPEPAPPTTPPQSPPPGRGDDDAATRAKLLELD